MKVYSVLVSVLHLQYYKLLFLMYNNAVGEYLWVLIMANV